MKKIYTILVCVWLLAGFVACEKDKDFALTTLTVQNETITPSYGSATIDCSFKSDATISEAFVQYSLSSSFAKYDVAKMTEEKGKYAAQLTGLADNTTYYIRYAVSNKYSSVMTEEVIEFQTLQCTAPTVILDSIADVWDNHAKAYIHLTFDGGASVTDMGVCWGTQANPTIEDIHKSTKDTVAVLDIPSLQPNTQYYVRAYAVNKVSVAYSEELVFTTYALPEVRTEEIADIQVNTALLSATLVFNGNDTTTIKGFCWSDKAEPTIDGNHIAVDTTSPHYTYVLSELLPATEYHVRAYAKNKIGVAYGEEKIFTTSKEIVSPTVTTAAITQITETTAVAGGNVTSDGGASVTERGVVYATTQNPTTADNKVSNGSGMGTFTCNLTDLQPNTKYYVRAYAINEKGTAYGEEMTFTTNKQIVLPSVTTAVVTQITETTAVAGGNVTSDGGASVTERGVVYSTNHNPTTADNKVAGGSGVGTFTCNLTGLQPNTTYYVRAYAENSKGTTYGEEVTFTPKANVNISDPTGTENGYGYVDLGLSVKWATMNVGASSPEYYGDYFAWGEVEPKEVYDWSTYKWCNGSSNTLTKYNTSSSYGTVDNKTTLELSDDAARVNWGGAWRMPTEAEWTELRTECTWTIIKQNGVNGCKVTSKYNNNSIFFPSAGIYQGNSLVAANSNRHYWSSSLSIDVPIGAWTLDSYSNYIRITAIDRRFGHSVRPVLGENEVEVTTPTVTTTTVTQITETSAVAGGNVTSDGGASVTERGVVYSTNPNPVITNLSNTIRPCGSGTGAFNYTMTGLQPNTTYYVRAYAINEKGTAYGEEMTFTTNKQIVLPSVTNAAVTQITETSAVAGGNVTNDGNASVTKRGVVYSVYQNPTISDSKVSSGSGVGEFTCNLTDLQPNTTYYVRAYAVNSQGTAYSKEVSFTTKEVSISDPTGTENGYGYVDLGLSVKWATMNVGAESPEGYGDYFAWGETKTKTTYDWSTYKYCNGSFTLLSKYNTSNSSGIVDNKMQLDLSDDAARANWGGNWRMPTDAEITELLDECTWIWIEQDGVDGYAITSKKNGNAIFLPTAGNYYDNELSGTGNFGEYWSSSLNMDYPDRAWVIYFHSTDTNRIHNTRCRGRSVRPVCP